MNKYLVTIYGRSNLSMVADAGKQLWCKFVNADTKKEAKEKALNDLSKESKAKYLSIPRDVKVEIEDWSDMPEESCHDYDILNEDFEYLTEEEYVKKVSNLIEDIRNKYYSRLNESDDYTTLYSVSDVDDCEVFGTFDTYEEAEELSDSLEVSSQIQKIVRDKNDLTMDISLVKEISK